MVSKDPDEISKQIEKILLGTKWPGAMETVPGECGNVRGGNCSEAKEGSWRQGLSSLNSSCHLGWILNNHLTARTGAPGTLL